MTQNLCDSKSNITITNPCIILMDNITPDASNNIAKMKQLWSNKLGYNVSIVPQQTCSDHDELNSYLNDISSSIQLNKDVDALIFIYSGSGYIDDTNNYIICNNDRKLSMNQIKDKFGRKKCDYLSTKPKIFYCDYRCNILSSDDEKHIDFKRNRNTNKFNNFLIHSALSTDENNTNNTALIDAIYESYIHNTLSVQDISLKINKMINNRTKNKYVLKIEDKLQPNVYIATATDNILSISADIDSWRTKDLKNLNCNELQKWVKTLDINDKEYEAQLLNIIQQTGTTGQDIQDLNADITDIPKCNFSAYRHKANHMLHWLNKKMEVWSPKSRAKTNVPLIHDAMPGIDIAEEYDDASVLDEIEDITWTNKDIKYWSTNDLQNWIKSLDFIAESKRLQLISEIGDAEATGDDFVMCHSAQEIVDSFNSINGTMGEQIYGALVNIKNIWNVEDVEDMVAANDNILPETWRSKHIDEWELNELQSWIMSLEINNENDKRELVNTIADQEIRGIDFNSVASSHDIHESFPSINANSARLVYNELQNIR